MEVAELIALGAAKVIGQGGGRTDRSDWPNRARLDDQGAAELIAAGAAKLIASVDARS